MPTPHRKSLQAQRSPASADAVAPATGAAAAGAARRGAPPADAAREIGGPKGPEPTRFGDWEKNGRCIDF